MLRGQVVTVGRLLTGYRRNIIVGYPGLRLGNILYLTLQAHRSRDGALKVACSPADGTLELFPALKPLLIEGGAPRFLDQRIYLPELFFQRYGIDFTSGELEDFIASTLLPSRPPEAAAEDGRLVVNVRRGDYYSNPAFRQAYGFDVHAYLADALARAGQDAPVSAICVVSDDIDWCRANLQFLESYATDLEFLSDARGLAGSFWTVATARRLVLANSTFSYWAAYISNSLYGDSSTVVAPDLHSRSNNGGRAWQHAPGWQSIPVAPTPSYDAGP